jgi:hypothetical protein
MEEKLAKKTQRLSVNLNELSNALDKLCDSLESIFGENKDIGKQLLEEIKDAVADWDEDDFNGLAGLGALFG